MLFQFAPNHQLGWKYNNIVCPSAVAYQHNTAFWRLFFWALQEAGSCYNIVQNKCCFLLKIAPFLIHY